MYYLHSTPRCFRQRTWIWHREIPYWEIWSLYFPLSRLRPFEGPLTVAECHQALLGMARRKAPGSDDLPAEFYIRFWDVLGTDLVEVFNFCFSAGFLTRSQRPGVISLTFKKGYSPCC